MSNDETWREACVTAAKTAEHAITRLMAAEEVINVARNYVATIDREARLVDIKRACAALVRALENYNLVRSS